MSGIFEKFGPLSCYLHSTNLEIVKCFTCKLSKHDQQTRFDRYLLNIHSIIITPQLLHFSDLGSSQCKRADDRDTTLNLGRQRMSVIS